MPDSITPLDPAARFVFKGTLVPLNIQPRRDKGPSRGLTKYVGVRTFALAAGETDAVREQMESYPTQEKSTTTKVSDSTFALLRSFEVPVLPALVPTITAIAAIPEKELISYAQSLVQVRAAQVRSAQKFKVEKMDVGKLVTSLNTAESALQTLLIGFNLQPIGMLNLERIEMVPAGLQRGELVATIPLAPGEETAVTHKEWSVTSKEFTSIVTDSLENVSETGVTDNTDLSTSTTSQNQHGVQFNITGTVQGGIPMISGSSSTGVTAQDSGSQSATESIKHATSITQKASARSRQEHKTTISTTTVTGTSESSTRVLKNTSSKDPMRIDYFSLMRKWRVRLYRYGLRLTYDMVVPEPGAAMRLAYLELETLKNQIGPFDFRVKHSDLTLDLVNKDTGKPPLPGEQTIPKYQWYADQYQTSVPPFPANPSPITADVTNAGNQEWVTFQLEFEVPAGTEIKQVFLACNINRDTSGGGMILHILGTQFWPVQRTDGGTNVILENHLLLVDGPGSSNPFLGGRTGHQKVFFLVNDGENIIIQLTIELRKTQEVLDRWQADTWNALYNAAQIRYFAQQQEIVARISAIEQRLNDVDTLTLRREESDEIMKSVLKFALGTAFDFMPPDVVSAFTAEGQDLNHGIAFNDQSLSGLNAWQWTMLRRHEDMVRFINQAIEWENVVTFMYSYFWDIPQSWEFIRQIKHFDLTRQAFLRAGCARVVLTVRKGWEDKWLQFTETGIIDAEIAKPSTGPYLTIAQEIAAYDDRNYPGIPPANPAKLAVRLQDAVFTTASVKVLLSTTAVSIEVADSTGFVIGLQVVVDVEDSSHIQESVTITDVPDGSHIVVDRLTHTHDGTITPFPMLQSGDKGALIAEWNEYTPSSGIDIAVTSNLATIV